MQEEQQLVEGHAAFIAELRHWREVTGFSQKALGRAVGYTASYVSKVESGSVMPSEEFSKKADQAMKAGRSIVRRWREIKKDDRSVAMAGVRQPDVDDPQAAPSTALVVGHEHAELAYRDGMFRTLVRRQLRNVGTAPVTQYLIRVAVDRYPGDPERSNRLYREFPLTWEEIGLAARCGTEPMTWRVKHDRDAFKEVWLLFENHDGRFPLYPGESTWIEYIYTVSADKWGPWWQRAVRLPTQRMSLALDLPADLDPAVWGMETSMTAEASPFRTPITREKSGDRVLFTWSTEDPPLHTRYRIEWKFRRQKPGQDTDMETLRPTERMHAVGVVQEGDPVLTDVARPYALPAEAEDARRAVAQLVSTMERVAQVHTFAKGMGLAAPQIGIGRAAAIVRTPDNASITLLNPRIIDQSAEESEQYEGCLSFFDVRGMVPRPCRIEVEHQDLDGQVQITAFEGGDARLIAHEIDHLFGVLYRERMRPEAKPIPVSQYRGTGRPWTLQTSPGESQPAN